MSKNKTQPTDMSPLEFLKSVQPAKRQEDGFRLLEFFNRITDLKPKMWRPSIIGYGRYHYKYESGREGDAMLTGFSPRKASLSIYIMHGFADIEPLLEKLGKHKTGKSCLYVNKLDDIDLSVLEEMIEADLAYMRCAYQTFDE